MSPLPLSCFSYIESAKDSQYPWLIVFNPFSKTIIQSHVRKSFKIQFITNSFYYLLYNTYYCLVLSYAFCDLNTVLQRIPKITQGTSSEVHLVQDLNPSQSSSSFYHYRRLKWQLSITAKDFFVVLKKKVLKYAVRKP